MKLGEFSLVRDTNEKERLLDTIRQFNTTRTDYPRNKTVHALFSERARQTPDAVAVIQDDTHFDYRTVERASNQFARFLLERGIRPEECVGVILERPFTMVVAILGILKAGAAYVPIDFDAPFERKRFLLNDIEARLLVVERNYLRDANKLQWECPQLTMVFCADSRDYYSESEGIGEFMKEDLWDEVGRGIFDDISGGGWTSSYTGEWLSREVMDEYGENIRMKLAPYLTRQSRVLEIACSTGISMFRLAPMVEYYHGTDLSQVILDWSRRRSQELGIATIRLQHCPAHEIDRVDARDFDVVIANSVVQCFSGHNYFRDVLRKALALMTERGTIFLGNIWDLDLKDVFVRSLDEFRRTHLGQGYRTKVDRSEDLFLPRAFFEDLRHEFPEIVRIEFSKPIGNAQSELSEFGYDVILHIDKTQPSQPCEPRRHYQFDLRALDELSGDPLPDERSGPRGLAYIIFTSGTSGQPKGAMVEHRSIVRLVKNTNFIEIQPTDRCMQTGSLAFDASTFEIWGMLLNGGALFRPQVRAILDTSEITRLIRKHRITVMWLTASLFNQHVDSDIGMFEGLRCLLIGGEKLSVYHVNRIKDRYPELKLINGYGPTENTTFTTCYSIETKCVNDIPIGRPIANTEVLILDSNNELTSIGVPGEICAAGDGLREAICVMSN